MFEYCFEVFFTTLWNRRSESFVLLLPDNGVNFESLRTFEMGGAPLPSFISRDSRLKVEIMVIFIARNTVNIKRCNKTQQFLGLASSSASFLDARVEVINVDLLHN